jgi:predicted nuclease of predicted toxin-antitoxin system
MKFKLDENFGTRTQQIFRQRGHEVHTVLEEHLSGTKDSQLYQICVQEQRCLVTLNLDFADVIRYPPYHSAGIVVIRVPRNPSLSLLEKMVHQFLDAMTTLPIEQGLWIVETGRIRVHQSS